MRVLSITTVCIWALLLAACGPTFNWRETSITATSLVAMFPCKPKTAARVVALGGTDVELHMTGCDAAGVTVAVGHATISEPNLRGPVLAQWRAATLAGMHANTPSISPLQLARANDLPQSVMVKALGMTPGGRALDLQGAWFARDNEVFVALLYGEVLSADVAETFFSGLKFR